MSESKSKRRWIIVGPGILIAIILSLQIAIKEHTKSSRQPIVERQVIGTQASETKPAPGVDYMISQAGELKLSGDQIASLKRLQTEWQSKSQPLTEQMDRAAKEFERFMKKSNGKANLREIQAHAGAVSEMSRQTSSLRRVYWEKGLQVLDDRQRETLNVGAKHLRQQ